MSALRLALASLVALPLLAGCALTSSARPSATAAVAGALSGALAAEAAAEGPAQTGGDDAMETGLMLAGATGAALSTATDASGPVDVEERQVTRAHAARAPLAAADDAELADLGEDGDDAEEGDDAEDADEGEASEQAAADLAALTAESTFPRYTRDLSDEEIAQLFKSDLRALGSISVGFVEAGRVINAVPFPRDPDWIVVSPQNAYGTQETIDYATAAIRAVKAQYPDAHPLRVNNLSTIEGGWLRPHKSHQNGRDVDFAFYYPTVEPIRVRDRENYIDVEKNWALVKALVTLTDVQMILVDRRVQKVLYDHALAAGEDKAWLDSIFKQTSIIRHAKRHRDHFHVRFYNARAQELGRRIAPLLAQRPDQNVTTHRVRSGDNLGKIARRYGTTVASIKSANRMRSDFLRVGVVLRIPLRGPCNRCPVTPEVIVPPRVLPPEPVPVASAEPSHSAGAHSQTASR